jgi:hypothetical protein
MLSRKTKRNHNPEDSLMVTKASLFSQLLHVFPRNEFARIAKENNAEFAAKGFTCWTQFVSMLFCQLARADSLRDICNGLACCLGKLSHLGLSEAPKKSTLSYANAQRPAKLYEDLFWSSLEHFRGKGALGAKRHKFRFKNKLLSLDSTTISLCLSLFPWATFRRAKGGVKAHVLLDHADYMPAFVYISNANVHDSRVLSMLSLNPGSIVAMDRAYNDYQLFSAWSKAGVFFVTRMKDNALYEVVEERDIPQNSNIVSDEIIVLSGKQARETCPERLRRITVWDVENERHIVLITNHLDFGATTIAAIYKERWQIELFFKALKQNLKIKTFVGTSENAIRIQIWTALIALLLLKWLHHLSKAGWSLSNLATMVRLNLFTYRDLLEWLNDPFNIPPLEPLPEQLELLGPGLGQAT